MTLLRSMGTFFVAPFPCVVGNVRGAVTLDNSEDDLRNGCGIKLVSTQDPRISLSYWHTLPVFNHVKGDFLQQGEVCAEMGNTGWVETNGKLVPVDIRLIPPYPGTHTHISMGRNNEDGTYTAMDYSSQIDWSIPVSYNLIKTIQGFLRNISNLFNK